MDSECGKALGIKTWRFVTWRRACDPPAKSERGSLAMVPIESPSLPMTAAVSLVTPAGVRVAGLRFDQLVALLRELG
jgi:hypothetical protein